MSLGLLISTVGFGEVSVTSYDINHAHSQKPGLLILLKAEAPEALEVLFPLICGIGMGGDVTCTLPDFCENAQVTRASDGHECVLPGPLHRSNSWTRKYYLAFLELILILFAQGCRRAASFTLEHQAVCHRTCR